MAAAVAGGPPQMVTVKRELLAACMTCPLCHKLLRDATTISECLHTFCRKCICEKLTDEEIDCCPICNIDLGCVPVEKLRPDHNLQDLRAKIFPFKRRKVEAPENFPLLSLPVRRKERSLSSLVVNTPRLATQTALTGRQTRAVARRAAILRGQSPGTHDSVKREDEYVDRLTENSGNPSKSAVSRRQSASNAESSSNAAIKVTDCGGESYQDKTELWKPLNCLVEAANSTKSFKSSPQSAVIKSEHINNPDVETTINKTRNKEHLHKSKVQDEKNNSIQTPSVTAKARRLQGVNRKRKDLSTSAHALFDAASAQCDRRICPIWFQLLASFDQEGDPPLPQIPNSYLRIKDGNVPVSFIQKYLVRKLNLDNEAEVAVTCRGEPVSPATSLHNLVEQWLRGGSSQKLQASIGTSAKEFVMVLAYGRRKVSAQ
ncbi:E3 ubiquitin protein ligase DRIP2-like [Musa acuminata AAA Group]|uniref:E3 ubiquitin protein ligase DRIP2-like n=1 Tax=Musa acuminata AAA Group TaxID=214697 RepID=UPI0031D3022D